jgi:hypothetical protein
VSGNPLQIRRLYFIYTFIGLALCVLAGNLVSNEVPLRAGLSMDQFGLIMGLGQIFPAIVNMLTASLISRYGLEFWAVIVMPLIRIFLGILFVMLPLFTQDKGVLTTGFSTIFVFYMICPYLSNNALQSIIKRLIPESELGRHTSRLLLCQFIPGTLLGILATFLVEFNDDKAVPGLFNKLVLCALGVTCLFQLACSVVAFRMMKLDAVEALLPSASGAAPGPESAGEGPASRPVSQSLEHAPVVGGVWGWIMIALVAPMIPPFVDLRFRFFMRQFFVIAIVTGMSGAFIFPYFTRTMGWTLTEFQTLSAVMVCLGMLFLPAWGALTDKIGGRNALLAAQMGLGVLLLALATGEVAGLWVYIVLGFGGSYGLVGTGVMIGQQYLMVSYSDKRSTSVYIAAFTLIWGGGWFIGSLSGGTLLEWLKHFLPGLIGPVHYEVYFMICGMGHLLSAYLVSALPDTRPTLSRMQVGNELMTSLLKTLRINRP